jgi:hypothetical protein
MPKVHSRWAREAAFPTYLTRRAFSRAECWLVVAGTRLLQLPGMTSMSKEPALCFRVSRRLPEFERMCDGDEEAEYPGALG